MDDLLFEKLQKKVVQRIRNSKEQRLQVVQDYLRGDFSKLTEPTRIINRLNAKGNHSQARRLIEMQNHLSKVQTNSFEERRNDKRVAETNKIVHESLVGSNDLLSVRFLHRGSRVSTSLWEPCSEMKSHLKLSKMG